MATPPGPSRGLARAAAAGNRAPGGCGSGRSGGPERRIPRSGLGAPSGGRLCFLPVLRLNLISILLAALPAPPGAAPEQVERRLVAMGTGLVLEVEAATRAEALAASERAVRAIEATEHRLSTWVESSELSALNREHARQLDPATAAELGRALHWARLTDGAFDPTLGALIEAWGLRDGGRRPSDEELAEAMARCGHQRLALDGREARIPRGLVIEEGGWGKGAGLDRALEALTRTAAVSAVIDLGGQVTWFGDAPRTFDVADPLDRTRAVLTVDAPGTARSVATSGNSERRWSDAGQPLGHLIDPRTGRPAPDFGSVSVFAHSALDADALATGLFALGPEQALAFAERIDGVEAVVIEHGPEGLRAHVTSGLADRVSPLVEDLTLRSAARRASGGATSSPASQTSGAPLPAIPHPTPPTSPR
jgi:thiamine biosynthesis lipoprotein